jgi:nitrous oxidase accessory protein
LATLGGAAAATLQVPPGEPLAAALAAAAPGDTLHLAAGVHRGPLRIDRTVTLDGAAGAVVEGDGTGHVIVVDAPDVTVRGLRVRGSGTTLASEDSGIFVTARGDRAHIEGNRVVGNLIGVYLKGPADALVLDNTIVGRDDLRMSERGNGVHLWNTPGSVVADNDIRAGRDGIFVTTSKRNEFRGNRFRDLRFAVHYMYTNDSSVTDNVSLGNHVGYALMYSRALTVAGNRSFGDRDHGILLNYVNGSRITHNVVQPGGKKCVFIYNANKNTFRDNWFEGCGIGVHFTAGSERNVMVGNAFVGNRTQVKYVGTRWLDWSVDGRGNYWSDNPAFDLNGDGIADRPYRPNDMIDQVVWRFPAAKLLLNSPAVGLLRWAQGQFPGLHPGGVVDSAPLMHPPADLMAASVAKEEG